MQLVYDISLKHLFLQTLFKMAVQASSHQGDSIHCEVAGRQCLSNALCSIVSSWESDPNEWDKSTLDHILLEGDKLYKHFTSNGIVYPTLEEVPKRVGTISTPYYGTVFLEKSEPPIYSLSDALKACLVEIHVGCVFTMGLTNPSYSSAILKNKSTLHFFDSHSRDEYGMMSPDGKATMTKHNNVESLAKFIKDLASSLKLTSYGAVPFEVACLQGYSLQSFNDHHQYINESGDHFQYNHSNDSNISDSEFSGFESISDGEYTCRLYLATAQPENLTDSNISSCSSDTQSDFNFVTGNNEVDDYIDDLMLDEAISGLNDSLTYYEKINTETFDSSYEFPFEYTQVVTTDTLEQNVENCDIKIDVYVDETYDVVENNDDVVDVYVDEKEVDEKYGDVVDVDVDEEEVDENYGDVVGVDVDEKEVVEKYGDVVDVDADEKEVVEKYGDVNEMDLDEKGNYGDDNDGDDEDDDLVDPTYKVHTDDEDDYYDDEDDVPLIHLKRKATEKTKQRPSVKQRIQTKVKKRLNKRFSEQIEKVNREVPSTALMDINITSRGNEECYNNEQQVSNDDRLTPQRGRGRKRKRNEASWKRNIAKKLRNEGKPYNSLKTGQDRSQRLMGNGCGQSCKFKCNEKIHQSEREKIFHSFWQLADTAKRWQFLSKYASKKVTKTHVCSSARKRDFSFVWTLPKPNVGAVRVCKVFFLQTLSVSDKMVSTANDKLNTITGVCVNDMRGKHAERKNRISETLKKSARDHIESFKCLPSHYCRKDTSKTYLPANLNLTQMYYMYNKKCTSTNVQPLTLTAYRQIFDTEYNLSFHTPAKDRCDMCAAFDKLTPENQDASAEKYSLHIKNKKLARESKQADKELALKDETLAVACFDLEQVLLTPHSFESSLYYKRRLASFNFTIYDLGSRNGHCFVWNESVASRGACEVASCVWDFIALKVSEGKKGFIFYSDNCCAQNKNKYLLSMMWLAIHKFKLDFIVQKYLVKGHTQNEADSIHAAVESASRKLHIYTTAQWAATVRSSRLSKPYIVKELCCSDFLDFKALSENLKNFTVNSENDRVQWHNFKIIKITKENPNMFYYHYDFTGPANSVDLYKRLRSKDIPCPDQIKLQVLRSSNIPISKDKYKDLVSLCAAGIIPAAHHAFYLLLPYQ